MNIFEAILYLTLNIYHEARSEDQISQVAVAHVTLNRSHKRQQSVRDIVYEPYQFSWTHLIKNHTPQDTKALMECYESAIIALKGVDFTGGATYYHRDDINPYWSSEFTYMGQWGRHKFYRE